MTFNGFMKINILFLTWTSLIKLPHLNDVSKRDETEEMFQSK